jgi:HlyD family secretion protein
MKNKDGKLSPEILEYQPDAVEIEERPVPGKVRWVLYIILFTLMASVTGAILFKVDRIVVAQGRLITTTPTIVVQPLNTAVIRSLEVHVGDEVEKDQVLATLDPTFTSADLSQLAKQNIAKGAQLRRIRAELEDKPFKAKAEEGAEGRLQEQVMAQRKKILVQTRQLTDDKIAALHAKLAQNTVQQEGQERQLKLLRDVEGSIAKMPQKEDYRLRILDAQKARFQAADSIANLKAEAEVTATELKQNESDWLRFVAERNGQLMEQEVVLRNELEKIGEDFNKAKRLNDLVSLRAPQRGIVLKMAERSVGSVIQPAEPLLTLVPMDSVIELEVEVEAKDIGRIRTGDAVRIKLDAFPFQRHDTLPGKVRVISEDAFQHNSPVAIDKSDKEQEGAATFYRTRIDLLSQQLRNVPPGFRLMPGMKVRAEIKVGKRSVISYFLYPVIRALDEGLREP